jgi:hypothetical protein
MYFYLDPIFAVTDWKSEIINYRLWTELKHPAEAAFSFSARADQLIPTKTSLAAFYPMASVPACGGVDFPAREVTCTDYATILAIRWPSFSAPPDNRMLLPIRLCSRNRMAWCAEHTRG